MARWDGAGHGVHGVVRALVVSAVCMAASCGGAGSPGPDESLADAHDAVAKAAQLPVCPAPPGALKTIAEVQGPGLASPLAGQAVTVRGVVTGDFQADNQLRGFFMQQTTRDNDSRTSEGVFVFAPGSIDVVPGDVVQVSGTVAEFPETDVVELRATQIASVTALTLCGHGLVPTPRAVQLPVDDPAELERYEGMLVRFTQKLSVTDTFNLGRFGELVLSAGGRLFHPNNGTDDRTTGAQAGSTVVLDDGSTRQNPSPTPHFSAPGSDGVRRLGDSVRDLTGVLTQAFGAYRVHATAVPAFQNDNRRRATPPAVGGTLKAASLNVLNYFTTLNSRGADTAAELVRQRDKLVAVLQALDADVVGLIEVQNDSGAALETLVAALNDRVGAGVYTALPGGVAGDDEIRVAIIYKGASLQPVGVPQVSDDPRFIVDGGLRPPLAQRFASRANGGGFWFIVNHFKSKGSCPQTGDIDVGQGCWNLARTRQARALTDHAAALVAGSGEPDMLMVGDFNAYPEEDPIVAIGAAGFEELAGRLPARERYSFAFDGQVGLLDHEFASASLASQVSGVAIWHVNADEPPVIDYNLENKPDDRYAPTPFRASDHDPVLVGLNLHADALPCPPALAARLPAVGDAGQPVQVAGIHAAACGAATLAGLSIDWGDGTPVQALAPDTTQAGHVYAAAGSYTLRLRAHDNAGLSVELAGSVAIAPAPGAGEGDVFISEYVEGSGNNKALELFNPGSVAVDLGAYSLRLYNNGATTPNTTLPLSGVLAAGATLVIANPGSSAALLALAQVTSGVTAFNGDDAVVLMKDGVVVDAIGQVGVDPGAQWSGGGIGTLDRTLRRKAGIVRGDADAGDAFDPSLEWDGFGIDTFSGLGSR